MERAMPVRNTHTATPGLLTWPEDPPSDSRATVSATPVRSHQPSDRIGKVLSGDQVSDAEVESLSRRKPCSEYKLKEISGSGIFAGNGEDGDLQSGTANPSPNSRTTVRVFQQVLNGASQISFGDEERVSPKKPTTLTEVAKQRELSGTPVSELETMTRKQTSDAKCKELGGNDIFGPPETTHRPHHAVAAASSMESKEGKGMGEPAPRAVRTSVKVSNPAGGQSNIFLGDDSHPSDATSKKIEEQKKTAEVTRNNIFNGGEPPCSEKLRSSAKLREMSGSDIFGDGVAEPRDSLGGVRHPPGGESTISLV